MAGVGGMELIKRLAVHDGHVERSIGLYEGDLAQIPAREAVDLLVVSAFPDSYRPLPGTLIGALQQRGLSLGHLAANKDHDLRQVSGFWLSKPLSGTHPDMHIGRIACFEPLLLGQPPQVVGELFRGLFPFLDTDQDAVVAMPLPGAGNQRWPPEAIFRPLLDAAAHWLRRGMPIAELKIVEIRRDRIAALAQQFQDFEDALYATAARPRPPAPGPVDDLLDFEKLDTFDATVVPAEDWLPEEIPPLASPAEGYDVFLSYAAEDRDAAEQLAGKLQEELADVRIFDYRLSIDIGQAWQQEIDAAIEGCTKIVALMSPDYFASPECKEELMVARLRHKRSNFSVFFPLYWKDAGQALALWLQAITYSDCREGDAQKLDVVSKRLASQLR